MSKAYFPNLFELRGKLTNYGSTIFGIVGVLLLLTIWIILTMGESPLLSPAILPSPYRVFLFNDEGVFGGAIGEMYRDQELIRNLLHSIGLNLWGYIEAVLIAIPIGFIIALFPIFRGLFEPHVNAIRFIPLTAVTGIFISWFGIQTGMKAHFLAFGILIYLLPVVIVRIYEVKDVYLKTVFTLGATDWQTIKTVYIPSVLSRISDDIRVLTAISWTYIIVAETIGGEYGIGNLLFRVRRFSAIDKIFGLLAIIIIIGVLQDRIFKWLDREFFPYKYAITGKYEKPKAPSLFDSIVGYIKNVFIWAGIAIYLVLLINEFFPFFGEAKAFVYFFGKSAWVIHLIFFTMLIYKVGKLIKGFNTKSAPNRTSYTIPPVKEKPTAEFVDEHPHLESKLASAFDTSVVDGPDEIDPNLKIENETDITETPTEDAKNPENPPLVDPENPEADV